MNGSRKPWAGHAKGSRGYRGVLIGLTAAGVATFAQLYSVQGVLPGLAADLDISASSAALTVSAATLGLAAAVIPWSAAADRFGRLPVMRLAILAAVVLGLVVPFSPNLPVLLVLRFAEGAAMGGIPAVALAYLSEEVSRVHAAVAAGSYVSGTTIGGLAGRIVAAPLSDAANWRVGVGAVSLLAAVAAVVFMLTAPKQQGFSPLRRTDPGPGLGGRLLLNLRNPRQLSLYLQGFLLMGGFVAVYNYLGFRLGEAPFSLPQGVASFLFLAYLAGTWSSRAAGTLAGRLAGHGGRKTVLLGSIAVMAGGLALTLAAWLPAVIAGLVVFTAGFFAAHSIASGWTPFLATSGRAQASSLYNLFYYAGSSVLGWAGGLFFQAWGWSGLSAFVATLLAVSAAVAAAALAPEPLAAPANPALKKP
ncbi:MFS transporter [Arthrobacter sp. zg-Y820]|uniref:MFS transporter n=1 Tax=unclassified Arthrobacter TaxID=235627 RepID=UPI002541F485|nr:MULTISPECIES: MFS transporter [unclassified Arthrobacter]MCC9197318.1 MFS transporter [Arthrobacter sp. zg-Y820]MDK1280183.1 MFS transporter [Arthrobacter sp. zg.Y820]WIB09474.1 MFS transporter [Arthrobacter sp. zg-Y820]